jgi:SulP family sulfate permease
MFSSSLNKNMFSNLKGDLAGAFSSAIIAIPIAIGFGIVAFSPMGESFLSRAALLGVYSAAFSGIVGCFFGGTPIQINSPLIPLTLVLTSVVAGLTGNPALPESEAARAVIIPGLAAVCVLIGGMVQLLLAVLRLGSIVKYIPFPVISGFVNGIAVILMLKQILPLLGHSSKSSFGDVFSNPATIQPLTLATGCITIAAVFWFKKHVKWIPASLAGMLAGVVAYYALGAFADASSLGPVIGKMTFQLPAPNAFLKLANTMKMSLFWELVPGLILPGLVIGLLGTMSSLLSAVVSDNLTGERHNSSRELVGQGLGNITNSLFGALPSGGAVPYVSVNYNAGGRTRLSGGLCGLFVFLMVISLGPLIGKVPVVVVSGLVMTVGIQMFNTQVFSLLRKFAGPIALRKEAFLNLLVTITVTVITVSVNIIVAVGIGVAIASALFISKTGKSIIKRKYFGNQMRSKKVRSRMHMDLLANKGDKIAVFELQGALFFGSAENLGKEMEAMMENLKCIILDMKRVNEIDSSAAQIMMQIVGKMKKKDGYLLISYLNDNPGLLSAFELLDVRKELEKGNVFPDTDSALEFAEDVLLQKYEMEKETFAQIPLGKMDIVDGFAQKEIEILSNALSDAHFKKGEQIIREGDLSRDIYFLLSGEVSVKLRIGDKDRFKRLVTYSPGVIFGEISFLDGSPRAAGVWVDEDARLLILSYKRFLALREASPEVAIKLTLNIAREQSLNLRRCSMEVKMLEES